MFVGCYSFILERVGEIENLEGGIKNGEKLTLSKDNNERTDEEDVSEDEYRRTTNRGTESESGISV